MPTLNEQLEQQAKDKAIDIQLQNTAAQLDSKTPFLGLNISQYADAFDEAERTRNDALAKQTQAKQHVEENIDLQSEHSAENIIAKAIYESEKATANRLTQNNIDLIYNTDKYDPGKSMLEGLQAGSNKAADVAFELGVNLPLKTQQAYETANLANQQAIEKINLNYNLTNQGIWKLYEKDLANAKDKKAIQSEYNKFFQQAELRTLLNTYAEAALNQAYSYEDATRDAIEYTLNFITSPIQSLRSVVHGAMQLPIFATTIIDGIRGQHLPEDSWEQWLKDFTGLSVAKHHINDGKFDDLGFNTLDRNLHASHLLGFVYENLALGAALGMVGRGVAKGVMGAYRGATVGSRVLFDRAKNQSLSAINQRIAQVEARLATNPNNKTLIRALDELKRIKAGVNNLTADSRIGMQFVGSSLGKNQARVQKALDSMNDYVRGYSRLGGAIKGFGIGGAVSTALAGAYVASEIHKGLKAQGKSWEDMTLHDVINSFLIASFDMVAGSASVINPLMGKGGPLASLLNFAPKGFLGRTFDTAVEGSIIEGVTEGLQTYLELDNASGHKLPGLTDIILGNAQIPYNKEKEQILDASMAGLLGGAGTAGGMHTLGSVFGIAKKGYEKVKKDDDGSDPTSSLQQAIASTNTSNTEYAQQLQQSEEITERMERVFGQDDVSTNASSGAKESKRLQQQFQQAQTLENKIKEAEEELNKPVKDGGYDAKIRTSHNNQNISYSNRNNQVQGMIEQTTAEIANVAADNTLTQAEKNAKIKDLQDKKDALDKLSKQYERAEFQRTKLGITDVFSNASDNVIGKTADEATKRNIKHRLEQILQADDETTQQEAIANFIEELGKTDEQLVRDIGQALNDLEKDIRPEVKETKQGLFGKLLRGQKRGQNNTSNTANAAQQTQTSTPSSSSNGGQQQTNTNTQNVQQQSSNQSTNAVNNDIKTIANKARRSSPLLVAKAVKIAEQKRQVKRNEEYENLSLRDKIKQRLGRGPKTEKEVSDTPIFDDLISGYVTIRIPNDITSPNSYIQSTPNKDNAIEYPSDNVEVLMVPSQLIKNDGSLVYVTEDNNLSSIVATAIEEMNKSYTQHIRNLIRDLKNNFSTMTERDIESRIKAITDYQLDLLRKIKNSSNLINTIIQTQPKNSLLAQKLIRAKQNIKTRLVDANREIVKLNRILQEREQASKAPSTNDKDYFNESVAFIEHSTSDMFDSLQKKIKAYKESSGEKQISLKGTINKIFDGMTKIFNKLSEFLSSKEYVELYNHVLVSLDANDTYTCGLISNNMEFHIGRSRIILNNNANIITKAFSRLFSNFFGRNYITQITDVIFPAIINTKSLDTLNRLSSMLDNIVITFDTNQIVFSNIKSGNVGSNAIVKRTFTLRQLLNPRSVEDIRAVYSEEQIRLFFEKNEAFTTEAANKVYTDKDIQENIHNFRDATRNSLSKEDDLLIRIREQLANDTALIRKLDILLDLGLFLKSAHWLSSQTSKGVYKPFLDPTQVNAMIRSMLTQEATEEDIANLRNIATELAITYLENSKVKEKIEIDKDIDELIILDETLSVNEDRKEGIVLAKTLVSELRRMYGKDIKEMVDFITQIVESTNDEQVAKRLAKGLISRMPICDELRNLVTMQQTAMILDDNSYDILIYMLFGDLAPKDNMLSKSKIVETLKKAIENDSITAEQYNNMKAEYVKKNKNERNKLTGRKFVGNYIRIPIKQAYEGGVKTSFRYIYIEELSLENNLRWKNEIIGEVDNDTSVFDRDLETEVNVSTTASLEDVSEGILDRIENRNSELGMALFMLANKALNETQGAKDKSLSWLYDSDVDYSKPVYNLVNVLVNGRNGTISPNTPQSMKILRGIFIAELPNRQFTDEQLEEIKNAKDDMSINLPEPAGSVVIGSRLWLEGSTTQGLQGNKPKNLQEFNDVNHRDYKNGLLLGFARAFGLDVDKFTNIEHHKKDSNNNNVGLFDQLLENIEAERSKYNNQIDKLISDLHKEKNSKKRKQIVDNFKKKYKIFSNVATDQIVIDNKITEAEIRNILYTGTNSVDDSVINKFVTDNKDKNIFQYILKDKKGNTIFNITEAFQILTDETVHDDKKIKLLEELIYHATHNLSENTLTEDTMGHQLRIIKELQRCLSKFKQNNKFDITELNPNEIMIYADGLTTFLAQGSIRIKHPRLAGYLANMYSIKWGSRKDANGKNVQIEDVTLDMFEEYVRQYIAKNDILSKLNTTRPYIEKMFEDKGLDVHTMSVARFLVSLDTFGDTSLFNILATKGEYLNRSTIKPINNPPTYGSQWEAMLNALHKDLSKIIFKTLAHSLDEFSKREDVKSLLVKLNRNLDARFAEAVKIELANKFIKFLNDKNKEIAQNKQEKLDKEVYNALLLRFTNNTKNLIHLLFRDASIFTEFASQSNNSSPNINLQELSKRIENTLEEEKEQYIKYYERFGVIVVEGQNGELIQKSLTKESLKDANDLLKIINSSHSNEVFFYKYLPNLQKKRNIIVANVDANGNIVYAINEIYNVDIENIVKIFNKNSNLEISIDTVKKMLLLTQRLYITTGSKFYKHTPLGLTANPVLYMQRVASKYINKSLNNIKTFLYQSLAKNSYELLITIGKKYGYTTRKEIVEALRNNSSNNSAFIEEVKAEQMKMYKDYLTYFLKVTFDKGFFFTMFKKHPSERDMKRFHKDVTNAIEVILSEVEAKGVFIASDINFAMENTGSSLEAMDYNAFMANLGFVFPDVNGLFNHNLEGEAIRNLVGINAQTFDAIIANASATVSANRGWGRQSEIYEGEADGAVILTKFLRQISRTNLKIAKQYKIDTGGIYAKTKKDKNGNDVIDTIESEAEFVINLDTNDIISYLDNIATIIKYLLTVSNTQTLGSANILHPNSSGQFDDIRVEKNKELIKNLSKAFNQQYNLYKQILLKLKDRDSEQYAEVEKALRETISFLPDNSTDININELILSDKIELGLTTKTGKKSFIALSRKKIFQRAFNRANSMIININDSEINLSQNNDNIFEGMILNNKVFKDSIEDIIKMFNNAQIKAIPARTAKISNINETIFDQKIKTQKDKNKVIDLIIDKFGLTNSNIHITLKSLYGNEKEESIIDIINNVLDNVLREHIKNEWVKNNPDIAMPESVKKEINDIHYAGTWNVVETTEENSADGTSKPKKELEKANLRKLTSNTNGQLVIDNVKIDVNFLLDAEAAIMDDVIGALIDVSNIRKFIDDIADYMANLAAEGLESIIIKPQSNSNILTPIDNIMIGNYPMQFVSQSSNNVMNYHDIILRRFTQEQNTRISDNLNNSRNKKEVNSKNITNTVYAPDTFSIRSQMPIRDGETSETSEDSFKEVSFDEFFNTRNQINRSGQENVRYENGTYKSVDDLMSDLNNDLNDMARQNPDIAKSIESIKNLVNNALSKTQSGLKVFYSNEESDAVGQFDPNTNTIIVYKNANKSTRLHEFLHAITEFALHDDSNEAQILISKIKSIQQQVKNVVKKDKNLAISLGLNDISMFNYVFGDNPNDITQNSDLSEIDTIAEFMATFMSEPNKIRYLQNTQVQMPTFRNNPNGGKTVLGRFISAIPELCKYLIELISKRIDKDPANAFLLMSNLIDDLSNYNTLDTKQKIVEANDNKWYNRVDRAFAKVINSSLLLGRFNIEKYAKNKGFNEAKAKELISEYSKEIDNSFILEYLEDLGTMAKKIKHPLARNISIATWLLSSFVYKSRFLINNPIQRSVVREAIGDLRQRVIEGSFFDWKILGDFGLYGTNALKKSMNLAGRAVGVRSSYNWQVEQARENVKKQVDSILTNNKILAKYLEDKTTREKFEIALDKLITHQNLGSFFINEDIINSKDLQRLIQYVVNPTMHLESIRNEAKANINEALVALGIDIDSIAANTIRKVVVDLANTRLTDTINEVGSSNIEMVLKQMGRMKGNVTETQLEAIAKLNKAITLETIALPVRQKNGSMSYFKSQTAAIRDVLYGQNTDLKVATIEAMANIVRLQAEQLKGVYKQRVLNTKANAFISKENKHNLYYLNNDDIYDEVNALARNSGDAYYLDSKKWYAYNSKRNIKTLSIDNIPEGSTIEQERTRLEELGYKKSFVSETSGVEVYVRDSNVSLTSSRHTAGFVFKNYNHKGQVSYLINERDVDVLKPIYNDEYTQDLMEELNLNYGADYTEDYLPKTETTHTGKYRGLASSETIMRDNSLTNERFEKLIGAKQTITDTLVEMEQEKQENRMRDFVNNQIFYQIIDNEAEIRQRKSKKLKKDEKQDTPYHHSEILFTIENGRLKFNESLIDKYGFELTKRDVADFAKLYYMYHKGGTPNSEVYIDSRLIPIMFGFNKLNYGALVKDSNNTLYKAARYIQAGVESILREAKNTIIIRNPKLVLINALGNFYGLVGEGIPLMTAAKSWKHYIDELNRYKQDWSDLEIAKKELNRLQRIIYRNKKYATKDDQIKIINSLETKIRKLEKDLGENKLSPLIQAGLYTNVVEDAETEGFKYYDTAIKYAEDEIKLSDEQKENVRNIFLAENSQAYKVMADMTRAGDFIPRAVLYYHILSKELPYAKDDKEVAAIKSKALDTVRDRFINYNMPMQSAIMRGLEGMGLVMFSKFRLAVQYQILKVFAKNPVRASGIVGLEYMLSQTGMNINPVTSYLAESIMLGGNLPNGMYNMGPGSVIGNAVNRWNYLI